MADETQYWRLQESIDRLGADLARVEIWADALQNFTQPALDYGRSESLAQRLAPHRVFDETLLRQRSRSDAAGGHAGDLVPAGPDRDDAMSSASSAILKQR